MNIQPYFEPETRVRRSLRVPTLTSDLTLFRAYRSRPALFRPYTVSDRLRDFAGRWLRPGQN